MLIIRWNNDPRLRSKKERKKGTGLSVQAAFSCVGNSAAVDPSATWTLCNLPVKSMATAQFTAFATTDGEAPAGHAASLDTDNGSQAGPAPDAEPGRENGAVPHSDLEAPWNKPSTSIYRRFSIKKLARRSSTSIMFNVTIASMG